MARLLFVVPPMVGHTNPTIAVARELQSRGHECAWVGVTEVLDRLLPTGSRTFPTEVAAGEHDLEETARKAAALRGFEGLRFLWRDVLVPLARAMHPGVSLAVDSWRPDVMCVDDQALAGALVARAEGIPWATSATTSAGRIESLAAFPKVLDWSEDLLADLQRSFGLDPIARMERSPQLVLVFSTEALVGSRPDLPASQRFVGPSFAARGTPPPFPWDELAEDRPRVLASLGTVNAARGKGFFGALGEALGDLHLQVVLVAPEGLGPYPSNFLVRDYVPQVELLARVDAVVTHGGHNTVCEALASGLPLVVAPIRDDQPVVAEQVVQAGCGVRVSFTRPRPAHLRAAVRSVLEGEQYRASAGVVSASFREAGGAPRAAALLEGLVPAVDSTREKGA